MNAMMSKPGAKIKCDRERERMCVCVHARVVRLTAEIGIVPLSLRTEK